MSILNLIEKGKKSFSFVINCNLHTGAGLISLAFNWVSSLSNVTFMETSIDISRVSPGKSTVRTNSF